MALLEAQIEGKYEILEKIKEGGMGAVYKVRHRFLDEIRVVKVIRSSLEASEELADRFQREARAAIRLRHPNIAQLHDFAVGAGGVAYIVMEFIDGLTLEDSLRAHGTPPLGLGLEIAEQSLKAIGYLHRRGFVHRDVAPDNLMLTRGVEGEPLVKLIDLGIAKVLAGDGSVTSTGMFLGKPRYASPEHFGAEGGLDGRSDVYSFGVVLYELLTGELPVIGRDPASFMAGHLLRTPRRFEETDPQGRIPPDLRVQLFRALAKRSADRFGTAEEFARELLAIHVRYPIGPRDLDEALVPPVHTMVGGVSLTGSTQDRLDAEFAIAATPSLTPTPPIASAPTDGPAAAETLSREVPPQGAALHHEPTQLRTREGFGAPGQATQPLGAALGTETPQTVPLPALPRASDFAVTREVDPDDWGDQTLLPSTTTRTVIRAPALAPPSVAVTASKSRGWVGWVVAVAVVAIAGAAWYFEPWREASPAVTTPARSEPVASPPRAESSSPTPIDSGGAPATTSVPTAKAKSLPGRSELASPPALAPRSAVADRGAKKAADTPPLPPPDPTLITAGPGVELAEPTSVPEAVYPVAARGSGLRPHLVVMILVDENGKVADAKIKSGDPSGLGFNEAALAAAKGAIFLPATRNGAPGRSWTELEIDFSPPS